VSETDDLTGYHYWAHQWEFSLYPKPQRRPSVVVTRAIPSPKNTEDPTWCEDSRAFIAWADHLFTLVVEKPSQRCLGFFKEKLLDMYWRSHPSLTAEHRLDAKRNGHLCLPEALLAIGKKVEAVELKMQLQELRLEMAQQLGVSCREDATQPKSTGINLGEELEEEG
jgi:hypothetical protein